MCLILVSETRRDINDRCCYCHYYYHYYDDDDGDDDDDMLARERTLTYCCLTLVTIIPAYFL